MRRLIQAILDRMTAHFAPQLRTLHRQFLLRVVDLEALSIEADIPSFHGDKIHVHLAKKLEFSS